MARAVYHSGCSREEFKEECALACKSFKLLYNGN
jgi:hypothetical protein